MDAFAEEFPERFIQCGIAEANMVGVAAGLAITGKIPFAGSFAEFITGRVYDQIRQEVAYGMTNVKLASSPAGITLGVTLPVHQGYNGITFALDLGQRGFGTAFVKEKYMGFHIGFNIFDIWFRKPQYQ